MARSGIKVPEEIINTYSTKVQLVKPSLAGLLIKLNDANTEVMIDEELPIGTTIDDVKAKLPENEPRYFVLDVSNDIGSRQTSSKIVFILWNPDSAAIKKKMLYASTKEALRKRLREIACEFQASELSDITAEEVASRMK